MSVLWLVVLTGILVFLQALLFSRFDFRRLHYERHFSVPAAHEGQRVELIESIRNEKLLPVPWLRAESRIPKELGFDKAATDAMHEVSGGMYHRSLFFLAPMCAITRHHAITLLRRSVYSAGSVALTAGDLFALVHREKQLELDCGIVVYPALLPDDALPDPAHRWLGEAVVKRWIMPDPFLVNGIRDYRPGDPMRDVHWKASARTGELRVKQRDYTSDPKALVILNVQVSPHQWSDVPPQDEERMEQAIRIAASLCQRALKSGMNAGFATNACFQGRQGKGEYIYVPTAAGSSQGDKLMDTMARMALHRELTFPTFLGELKNVEGEDILIISFYEDDETRAAVNVLRQQGNNVSVYRMERGVRV